MGRRRGKLRAALTAAAAFLWVVPTTAARAHQRQSSRRSTRAAAQAASPHKVQAGPAPEQLRSLERVPLAPIILEHQWLPARGPRPRGATPSLPITADERPARLTLREAIAVALENNPGIAVERLEPFRQEQEVTRALGEFDPTLGVFAGQDHKITPTASALAGALALVEDNRNANATLAKKLRTGATISLAFNNNRFDSNSAFFGLRPLYRPELDFSVTQPLLRDFGWGLSYLVVRIAEASSQAALHTYQAHLADFVLRVIEAYWGVVRATEELQVRKQGLELARTVVRQNRARASVGLLPPVAVKEAESTAALREEQVIAAENALDVARKTLRQLLHWSPRGTFFPRPIEPVDAPETEPVEVDQQRSLERAITKRPEVLASRRRLRSRRLDLRLKENHLLPRVDLTGSYGVNAISGKGVPQVDFRTGKTVLSPFAGDYADALDALTTNDFRQYSFGLKVEVPLGNAVAKSEYTESRVRLTQAELAHRQLLSDITLEVVKAIADLRSSRKRIAASRAARELAEDNLRNQQKRYAVGMSTTTDILIQQEKLTRARAAEVQAEIDYSLALARWRHAEGSLLDHYRIEVAAHGQRVRPWWSRF